MTVWIVLLTIGVLLFLLAMLRVGGIAEYSSQGLQLRLRIGWLKITLYPAAGGDKKAKQKEKKRKKAKTVQAEALGSLRSSCLWRARPPAACSGKFG